MRSVARYDPAHVKALQDHLQRVIAHEFVKGLHFISTQTEEAVAGLRADQPDLRDRLNEVRAKAHEMTQHARNVVGLADLERNAPQREMVNLRGLLEGVMKELFPYAEACGVHLQVAYGSLGPILTVRSYVHQACSNVIHNAIKYSFPGGVVKITLRLEDESGKRAVIEVRDHGHGIEAKDQERIFQLNVRGDGLVEPGSGLGLPFAQESMRREAATSSWSRARSTRVRRFASHCPMEKAAVPRHRTQRRKEKPREDENTHRRLAADDQPRRLDRVPSLLLPANTPSSKIALKSSHGRYVTALGEGEGWSLKQNDDTEPGDCGWFTQYHLANGKIALLTCHGRYVTAPRRGTTRLDWEVWQESGLGDCGQFDVVAQGSEIALKTCAGKYLTAGTATGRRRCSGA